MGKSPSDGARGSPVSIPERGHPRVTFLFHGQLPGLDILSVWSPPPLYMLTHADCCLAGVGGAL